MELLKKMNMTLGAFRSSQKGNTWDSSLFVRDTSSSSSSGGGVGGDSINDLKIVKRLACIDVVHYTL